MLDLSLLDMLALIFFALAWLGYNYALERSRQHGGGLNGRMDQYRIVWMMQMRDRDVRIVDTQIMGSLQSGTAFFASTSLLAIGGAATLLRATDDVLQIFHNLPFGLTTSRTVWEIKAVGLVLIFGYAYFKFSWSYRLFNYAAILLGATPLHHSPEAGERHKMAMRVAQMNIVAGRHFNRGQRAFFFALGYLGWFIGPLVFCAMTAGVVLVMAKRQFHSDALDAVMMEPPDAPSD